MPRETTTVNCPQCLRQIRVLADEYGDHGCACGWDIAQEERNYNEGDDAE